MLNWKIDHALLNLADIRAEIYSYDSRQTAWTAS